MLMFLKINKKSRILHLLKILTGMLKRYSKDVMTEINLKLIITIATYKNCQKILGRMTQFIKS